MGTTDERYTLTAAASRWRSVANVMSAFFAWLETTRMALAVRDSVVLTAGLSATHLLGFTLSTGGGLLSNLRLLGVLFAHRPLTEISRPATRGVLVGLMVSIITGALLFSPRAVTASENSTFQLKMLLLAAAAVFQFAVHQRIMARSSPPRLQRLMGALGILLWIGLALAGCAFILFE